MSRRLVVTVPDIECTGCRARAPATFRYIANAEPGALRADLNPPNGWVILRADHPPEGQQVRRFAICPRCYAGGQPDWGMVVDAHYEARET